MNGPHGSRTKHTTEWRSMSSPDSAASPSPELLATLGLERSRFGFYEAKRKPTRAELETHYRDVYYQKESGSYQSSYDDEELAYVRGRTLFVNRLMEARGWQPKLPGSLLDVGCGEGHTLAFYAERGWSVRGLDYSAHALTAMNPQCLPWLTQGDVFANLEKLISEGMRYDLVFLDNVLEHVVDPLRLLQDLHQLAKPSSVMVIEVPNDFSPLQMFAMERGFIDRAFWVTIPEHLAYFTGPSLRNVCAEAGWKCDAMLADFPVDWFVINPNSNYILPSAPGTGKGTNLGKGAHRARIALENLMRETDIDRLIDLYEAMAALGMGRCLSGFFRIA
jgi:2-polyprenyl-3-methyl-5-hydroxy-6-metoxy-1,4-benzoquinol methylase